MKQARRLYFVLSIFLFSGVCLHSVSAATVRVNVCEWAIKQVFIPPTYKDIVTCNTKWQICAFVDPACCIPVVCNSIPHCQIAQKVIDVAGHWGDQPVLDCSLKDLDPAVEFEKWLRQQIPALDDLLLPGAFDAAKLHIAAMKLAATPIPNKVKAQVTGLIQPFATSGTAKFSNAELNVARIVSNSNINASLYLRQGFNGITLDDLIVVRNSHHMVLMDSSNHNYTVSQITSGSAPSDYVNALLLLIHELVHVKQFASLGLDAFLTNYLIETVAKGYGSDSFEQEADAFAYKVAETIPGMQEPELGVVKNVATALGVHSAAVIANEARWIVIAKWFQGCVAGKEVTRGVSGPIAVQKGNCGPVAVRKFRVDRDRSKYPLEPVLRLPVEKVKTPTGKEAIIPPKPTEPSVR